jgi:hypothetical protein
MQTATTDSIPALTLASVEAYHADPMTRELKDKLFIARAHALVVRAVIDELLVPAFALTNYTVDGTGSPRLFSANVK